MIEQGWLTSNDPQAMLALVNGEAWREWPGEALAASKSKLVSDRKLRLFAAACCRQVWHLLTDDVNCNRCTAPISRSPLYYTGKAQGLPCPDCGGAGRVNRSRRGVEVAERYADGQATAQEFAIARSGAREALNDFHDADDPMRYAAFAVRWLTRSEHQTQELVADCQSAGVAPAAQAALLREVVGNPFRPATFGQSRLDFSIADEAFGMADTAYRERLPDGTLDPARLAVLADALEEAGCTDEPLLMHLRGFEDVPCASGGVTQAVVRVPLRGSHVRGCWALDLIIGKE